MLEESRFSLLEYNGRTIRKLMVGGGGWKLKKYILYSCKGKDTEEVTEIRMEKKKRMKKISYSSKAVLHSYHNFSNGLTLTVSTREKHIRMAWKIC